VISLNTCEIIGSAAPLSFRLSFIQRLFFSEDKNTNWKINSKNTEEQIIKRYILYVNKHLSILLTF